MTPLETLHRAADLIRQRKLTPEQAAMVVENAARTLEIRAGRPDPGPRTGS